MTSRALLSCFLFLIRVSAEDLAPQYIENGEIVTAGQEDANRAKEFSEKRREKIENHRKELASKEGMRFTKPVETLDRSALQNQLQTDIEGEGSTKFDARKIKQVARKGEDTVVYVVGGTGHSGMSWSSFGMYWGLNITLVVLIYAYCRSPYARYLKPQPKAKKIPGQMPLPKRRKARVSMSPGLPTVVEMETTTETTSNAINMTDPGEGIASENIAALGEKEFQS
ncbi:hypothetical protein AAMO2058_001663400 [Amorphochlora amoebiformis]